MTGRLTALSRFLSYAGDKSIYFFVAIKKLAEFVWTEECEKEFVELKQFLFTPPILARSKKTSPLILYLAVSEKEISLVLVQDNDGDERQIYFVSKVLKGAEARYQKIERLALAVVVTARKLRQYF